ncbi:MAG: ParA family protein [Betaproteobacteria bacterium]
MIVQVCAEKGGVGKTSIAVNLATIAATDEIDVLLLDTDSTGSATAWGRIRQEGGVAPSISILTLSTNPASTLADLAPKYDLIVVDVGARSYSTMLQIALLADLVIVPTTPGQFEAESTLNLFQAFRDLDPRHKGGHVPAHVLLNMVPTNERSREEAGLRDLLKEESVPVMHAVIRTRKAWRDCSRTGRAVHELSGRDASSKGTLEMRAVYEEAEGLIAH